QTAGPAFDSHCWPFAQSMTAASRPIRLFDFADEIGTCGFCSGVKTVEAWPMRDRPISYPTMADCGSPSCRSHGGWHSNASMPRIAAESFLQRTTRSGTNAISHHCSLKMRLTFEKEHLHDPRRYGDLFLPG